MCWYFFSPFVGFLSLSPCVNTNHKLRKKKEIRIFRNGMKGKCFRLFVFLLFLRIHCWYRCLLTGWWVRGSTTQSVKIQPNENDPIQSGSRSDHGLGIHSLLGPQKMACTIHMQNSMLYKYRFPIHSKFVLGRFVGDVLWRWCQMTNRRHQFFFFFFRSFHTTPIYCLFCAAPNLLLFFLSIFIIHVQKICMCRECQQIN